MALSRREEKVLATIEDQIRVEDPRLTAALCRTPEPPAAVSVFPLSNRRPLRLLAALIVLVIAVAFLGERLGAAGIAVLTVAAVVPWMVGTARSAGRRSRRPDGPQQTAGTGHDDGRGRERNVERPPHRWWPLAVVPVVIAAALMPPAWQGAAALVVMLAVTPLLPWLVVGIVERVEKRNTTREKRSSCETPISPDGRTSRRGGRRVPERGPQSRAPLRTDCGR